MAENEHPEDPPSLPEAVRRERANEPAGDGGADSLPGTERRGRHAAPDEDDSLPGTARRERGAERGADAERAQSDTPPIPGVEERRREE